MASLDRIIDWTKLYQDVELSTAITQLKNNPSQLQQFLQNQQDKVFKDVLQQKDETFNKVYGDLNRASQAQESMLMHQKRNIELLDVSKQVVENQKNSANAVMDDKNIANRKFEMNEWTVNNKRDTLFVFSMLFVMLSAFVLLTALWRYGVISAWLWGAIGLPLIIIFVLTVVNRSQYTDVLRNKRYWNKQIFEGKYGKIPVPNICPDSLDSIQKEFEDAKAGVYSGITSASQGLARATQSIARGTSSFAKGVSDSLAENAAPAN